MRKLSVLFTGLMILTLNPGCSWLADVAIHNIKRKSERGLSDEERRIRFEEDFYREQNRQERLRQQKERTVYPSHGDWRDQLPPHRGQ